MNLAGVRTNVGIELADTGADIWINAEIDRAVDLAVADISRMFPRERVREIWLDQEVDNESWTSSDDTRVALTNSPIKRHSETVTKRGAITVFADYTGTVAGTVLVTDASHTLSTGDSVTISGTTSYNGTFTVTKVDGNTFYITATWVANDGSSLWVGGTTYARDTDYWVDYSTGEITSLSAGDIVNSTATNISYKRDPTIINTSSDLTNPIRIVRVEHLEGQVPQDLLAYEWFGDYLTLLTSGRSGSQSRVPDFGHIKIWYEALHTAPTTGANGTFPRLLDELMVRGTTGYVLRIESLTQESLARTAAASGTTSIAAATTALSNAATAIAKIDDEASGITTALTAVNANLDSAVVVLDTIDDSNEPLDDTMTQLDSAVTELAKVVANATSASDESALANSALDKVDVLLLTGGSEEDAQDVFDGMAGNIVNIGSKLDAIADSNEPLADMEAALDKVSNFVQHSSPSSATDMEGALDDANTAIDAIVTTLAELRGSDGEPLYDHNRELDLAAAQLALGNTAGGEMSDEIDAGADSIDDVLDDIVAFTDAASTALAASAANLETDTINAVKYLADGDNFLNTVTAGGSPQGTVNDYVAFANAQTNIAQTFVGEAQGRVVAAQARIAEARERTQLVMARAAEVQARATTATGYVSEANSRLGAANILLEETSLRVQEVDAQLRLAQGRQAQAQTFIEEANGRAQMSAELRGVASGFGEAVGAINIRAQGIIAMAQTFVAEAVQRIGTSRSYVEIGQTRIAQADSYVSVANGRIAHATAIMNHANTYITTARGFGEEAQARIAVGSMYAQQGQSYRTESQGHTDAAQSYHNAALRHGELADRYKIDSETRLREFKTDLNDRTQLLRDRSTASRSQFS